MESQLLLEIVTPDKVVVDQAVEYIGVPGVVGEFGVLPHHAPLLSALAIGKLYFRADGKTQNVFVSGGFAEVSGNKITVLAESAELAENIDVARARAAMERAKARLESKEDTVDIVRAQSALHRAIVRLDIADGKD